MMRKTYNGIHTGYGCKVVEDIHGGVYGSVLAAYYECDSVKETAQLAITLLDSFYEVTLFTNGYFPPRSYHSKRELRRDFIAALSV